MKKLQKFLPVFIGLLFTTIALADPNEPVTVLSLDGRIVHQNVSRRQARQGLNKGIYIIDGQKIAVSK